jgi:hypothetical protein
MLRTTYGKIFGWCARAGSTIENTTGRLVQSLGLGSERGSGQGNSARMQWQIVDSPSVAASKGSSMGLRAVERQHNRRLKQTPRVDYGMNLFSARRCLAAVRYAAHDVRQSLWLVH